MAESLLSFDDAQLERALIDLGRQIDYPPTPDIALGVRRRLATQPPRRRVAWWDSLLPVQRAVLAAFVALGVLAALVFAAFPEVRTVVADRLGLRGVEIREVSPLPSPAPTATLPVQPAVSPAASPSPMATPTGTPVSMGSRLSLGEPTSLQAVRTRVEYQVLIPTVLDPPDQVYLRDPPPGGQVALVYLPRAGLPATAQSGVGALLTQFRGALPPNALYGKGLPPGTRIEEVSVNGFRGYWIEGEAHTFFFQDAQGRLQSETLRLAGNVLLWEQADLTLRLELALTKPEAVRIAASVQP